VIEVTRTVVVESAQLPRKVFRIFVELESMYRNMVEQLALYAVRSELTSFTRLKALKYRELRSLYLQLPSHYAYTACQDASTRAKSFLRLKKSGLVKKDYPEVRKVSIWFDDHLWRVKNLTSMEITTHRGWVAVEMEPHKQFWKYVNSGWRLASEAKVKLDKRSRRLVVYLTFKKSVEVYRPRGFVAVDVNENHVAVLADGKAHLFETNFRAVVLSYYYRRKRVQEKYDKLYGVNCRVERRALRKLKERKRKSNLRWKLANIIVRVAKERQYAVVLERLGKDPSKEMINHINDEQLRHRIYQASFKGIQKAIEEKAEEHGVPVIYVNPKNTSRMCPVHNTIIIYSNGSRIGKCSKCGEPWHRDVVACYNLLLRARLGDGSVAPSLGGLKVDGSPVPLGSTATHDPIVVARALWARWKSLGATNKHELLKMSI
jgi:IS605 OrfB family transposase